MCGKFTVKPDCALLMMKQFGKPRLCMPCSVAMPSAHFSVSVSTAAAEQLVARAARVVRAHLEARREDQAVQLVLLAVRDDALLRDPLDALALRVDERARSGG